MKTFAIALLLLGAGLVGHAGHAAADPFARHAGAHTESGGIPVPAEWAGVWVSTDSVFKCPNIFQSTSSDTDTLCAGQIVDTYPNATCSGSSDIDTIDETCTATGEVFTDCQYTITFVLHGTRTGDTFNSTVTTNSSYSGTGAGCDLIPPSCTKSLTYATRIGPAPASYCASPTQPTTWGKLKSAYR